MKKALPLIKKFLRRVESPIGTLGIAEDGKGISDVFFVSRAESENGQAREILSAADFRDTPLLREAAAQLSEYFSGKRKAFALPLSLRGTAFQSEDWRALQTIPYGETRSYKQIAAQIGKPGACRAVGMANNRNPVSIIIPCHRVIGHDGSLVGYGSGLPAKAYLLELERSHSF